MNEEKVQALKDFQEKGYAVKSPNLEERPKIDYLLEHQRNLIYEIFVLKNEIESRLHRLQNTNYPQETCTPGEPVKPSDDVVSRIEDHNRDLSRLMEDFHGINKKLIGLI